MKIFFDLDDVLIDGWHANPSRRILWDAAIEQHFGIDRERFQRLLFAIARSKMLRVFFVKAKSNTDVTGTSGIPALGRPIPRPHPVALKSEPGPAQ